MLGVGVYRKLQILFGVIGLFRAVEALKLTARLPGIEDNWEKQLETGLIALEANCDQNYMPFNREKLQNELKECLRTIIAQEPTNYYNVLINPTKKGSPTQVDIFRHIYIEPICNKISQSLGCLKPHKMIIDNCARDDGKALQQLMNVSCRGNGTKLIEFLEAGGIDCVLEERESILSCFATVSEQKRNLTSSAEVCSYFRQSRDCFMDSLFHCANNKPGEIVHGILEEVAKESEGNCLTSQLRGSTSNSHSELYLLMTNLLVLSIYGWITNR